VVRTRVGYTGGTLDNPTYRQLGDHTESVQIDYDPEQITYRELLEVFWSSHNPRTASMGRQYMAAVFYHDDRQQQLAVETRDQIAEGLGQEVHTQILPAETFYLAEDYHQKYNLRRYKDIYGELAAVYPTTEALIASTAAARLNGYVAGYGTREQLDAEIERLGLSEEAQQQLRRLILR
jgi:peptide-methionine (S)-S-oxide reductase